MPGPDDVSGVILVTLQALNHCHRYVVCLLFCPCTLPGACLVIIIIIVANITTTTTVAVHNIQRSVDSW